MGLYTLLYTSTVMRDMTTQDLKGILDVAREFNARL